MSEPLAVQAQPVVANLLNQDPDQLYAELGKRVHAIRRDAALAGSFTPAMPPSALMGLAPTDAQRAVGKQFFNRLNVQAYGLVCGSDSDTAKQRSDLVASFGSGSAGVGGVLAALLVSQLGLAPALAGVVAALILKLFFKPVYDTMCSTWEQSLTQASSTTQPGG